MENKKWNVRKLAEAHGIQQFQKENAGQRKLDNHHHQQ